VAAESAMKYFVLGAIASGTLLYGISILYGVTGSFDLGVVQAGLSREMFFGGKHIGLLFGLAFIVVGVAFKFGAVPFHQWVPDVYHGAPTSVTLLLGSVPKLASFALAWRVLAEGLGPLAGEWRGMLIVLSVLSMVLGNVVAIAQTNIKRMLAYSTISHVGFILLGILTGTPDGYAASLYYTVAYVIMATASFGMVILLSRAGFEADRIDDFKGLAQRSPWFAWMMLMVMMSTAGVPPFIGFFAKLYVIQAVLNANLVWLAIVAVLASVVGAYYYLRIVKVMFFDAPEDRAPALQASPMMRIVLSGNALAVLAAGIISGPLTALCRAVIPG
jgi:NADH-quinone oxidoreductase subunit N